MKVLKTLAVLIFLGLLIFLVWIFLNPEQKLSISPSTGTAPLSVTVINHVNNGTIDSPEDVTSEYMNFGDGTPAVPATSVGTTGPSKNHVFTHMYTKPGAYQITFFYQYPKTVAYYGIPTSTQILENTTLLATGTVMVN